MANVTKILDSQNIATITPTCVVGGTLVVGLLAKKKTKVVPVPALVVDGECVEIPTGINGNVSPVAAINGKIVCTVVLPRKPQGGIVLATDGSSVPLEMPKGKGVNIFPFWANSEVILGRVLGPDGIQKTGVWAEDGSLVEVLEGTFIGKVGGQFINYEFAPSALPEGYSLPVARVVNGNAVGGAMFLNDKRSTVNTNSWVAFPETGATSFLNTDGQPFSRFAVQRVSSTGDLTFGLGFNPNGPDQWGLVYETASATFKTLEDAYGVALDTGSLVLDGNVIYGRAADGLYKVEV